MYVCMYIHYPVPNNRGSVNKRGGLKNNLNINKRGGPNKMGSLKIVLSQKWQPVITNYGDCFG